MPMAAQPCAARRQLAAASVPYQRYQRYQHQSWKDSMRQDTLSAHHVTSAWPTGAASHCCSRRRAKVLAPGRPDLKRRCGRRQGKGGRAIMMCVLCSLLLARAVRAHRNTVHLHSRAGLSANHDLIRRASRICCIQVFTGIEPLGSSMVPVSLSLTPAPMDAGGQLFPCTGRAQQENPCLEATQVKGVGSTVCWQAQAFASLCSSRCAHARPGIGQALAPAGVSSHAAAMAVCRESVQRAQVEES